MENGVFPKNFLWGTATSAHQVEGNNTKNDMWEWEHSRKRVAELERRDLNPKDFQSGRACDHYSRFDKDFGLASSLGTNAHRFSLEWSRIEPEEGVFDQRELDHYRRVLLSICRHGMEPFVTLWHFTSPLWFTKLGGWENKDAVFYFSRYASRVVEEYKDIAQFWLTLNEPNAYVGFVYSGKWLLNKKSWMRALRVFWSLSAAHIAAYHAIHRISPSARAGVTILATHMMPRRSFSPLDRLASWGYHLIHNAFYLRLVKNKYDFLGIDYYHRSRVAFSLRHPPVRIENLNIWINDMGWEVYPKGIYHIATWASRYGVPVYITENGTADADDDHRERFIVEHLSWLKKAIDDGADVRGYFHWSLTDNFEWAEGFRPRFGLFEMNYETLERKARPSAETYKKICETNRLP